MSNTMEDLKEMVVNIFGERVVKESKTTARERAYRALDILTGLLKPTPQSIK